MSNFVDTDRVGKAKIEALLEFLLSEDDFSTLELRFIKKVYEIGFSQLSEIDKGVVHKLYWKTLVRRNS